MVLLHMNVISVLIFYVIPFSEKYTKALMRSNTKDGTKKKDFDFRDVVVENSAYAPLADVCPLRIIGGIHADIREVPYQVVIRRGVRRGDFWGGTCGGSILTPLYILTAAHCFNNNDLKSLHMYRVIAGTEKSDFFVYSKLPKIQLEDYKHLFGDEVWKEIVYCYRHAGFKKDTAEHDIAVLELKSSLSFSDRVKPIPMLRESLHIQLEEQVLGLASGFGLMEHRKPSLNLLMVCLPIVDSTKCRKYYGNTRVSHNQFCAGETGKDSCEGDSGGPFTYHGYLAGIVSHGIGFWCGRAPGLYTRVSSYTTGESIPLIRGHCIQISYNVFGIAFLVLISVVYTFIVT